MYCTKQYFEFICFVELVYLNNLNLEMMMMMAYADGDIIHVIKVALLESDAANEKFSAVCNNEDTEDEQSTTD